ncbi:MAG: NUDIX domain-containing protein [Candidatus Micrarchaeota archaeon]|nr:NUDIX domain-containing protein [Candidatus Micrarchaeota archaeon]
MRFEYSAGGFVYRVEKGRVLMLFLINKEGKIGSPKGHIEKGEHAAEAAQREIREESGLNVEFIPYFKVKTKYFFMHRNEKILKELTLFLARTSSAKVRVSDEHEDFVWLDREGALSRNDYKDMGMLIGKAFDYIGRYEAMRKVNAEYEELRKKHREWDLSHKFVPGDGPLDAKVMVVGQAPGANEDLLQKPFVGRSGQILTAMLKLAKLKREEVYITSCVQYFPPKNRLPTKTEVAAFKHLLFEQLGIVRPKFVIIVGNLSCHTLLGYDKVRENHGKIVRKDGITYFITFHPAMALRSSKVVAELMRQDFKKIGEKISGT